jgi:hypothetical protein
MEAIMKKKRMSILSILLIIGMVLTGCSTTGSNTTNNNSTTGSSDTAGSNSSDSSGTVDDTGTSSSDTSASDNTSDSASSGQVSVLSTTSTIVVDKEFTANDLEVGYEDSTSTHVTLNGSSIEVSGDGASADNGVLTISQKGTYVISGSISDGQILVDAGENDKVQIVLNGVSINCADSAPIYVKNADKVFITLQEGTENTLTDGTSYTQTDDNTVDAVIFSMADLTINGQGTLNITANYKHGIVSKDDLVFTGGTYNIKAVKNTINGKDCVKIKDGNFTLAASTGKGITSKNGDDTTKGYVYISGGTINITTCQEGIEGTAIVIDDGTININAQDDGFNAASKAASSSSSSTSGSTGTASDATAAKDNSGITAIQLSTATTTASAADSSDLTADTDSSTTLANGHMGGRGGFGGDGGFGGGGGAFENDTNCYLSINGGSITVNAQGDGLDSNGSMYISGGDIYVSGPTESMNGGLDYNGTADVSGGTIVVAGSVGMAQGFSDTSSQYSLLYNLTGSVAAGTEITLKDQDGNVVISYTPDKLYQSVVISTPDLTQGETYTLTCGDQTADITLDTVATSNGQQGMGFPGMGGKR